MVKKKQRITKVVVDTSKTISQLGIQIPRIDYKVIADVTMQTAFNGMITPIPTVLIHHLRPLELLFVAVVIEDTIEHGECFLKHQDFADRMGVALPTVSATKSRLKKMEVITIEKRADSRYICKINWDAVNNLDQLMQKEPRAIMARVRNTSRKRKISNMTRSDIESAYTERVLPPDHDPREEETYD
jgi:hypothetical protein